MVLHCALMGHLFKEPHISYNEVGVGAKEAQYVAVLSL